jgi:hypothetical protein
METIYLFETLYTIRTTWRYKAENFILHSHSREILKSSKETYFVI